MAKANTQTFGGNVGLSDSPKRSHISDCSMKILAITCCFNRKEKTLSALDQIQKFFRLSGFEYHTLVVDDCSFDGSYEAIGKYYPDIEVIRTNGNAYWAGAIRFGWEHMGTRTNQFDAVLVFNDDIELDSDRLTKNTPLIVQTLKNQDIYVGQFRGATNTISYGLNARRSLWHPLKFGLAYDTGSKTDRIGLRVANFNFVLIPVSVIEQIGFLKPYFVHKGADFEFSLRAFKAGFNLVASDGFIGMCERNTPDGSSRESGISFAERWRRLTGDKEEIFFMRYKYYSQHAGLFWPFLFLAPYIALPFKHLKEKCF